MTTASNTDVLVLGGGVIGLSCAYHLAAAGRSVVVLEQGTIGSGSSHGNCGTLTPSHAMPLAMPGTIGMALRWLLKPDAPLRIKPRIDIDLLRWLFAFSRRCNLGDALRATAAKAPLLLRSRAMIEAIIEKESIDCDFAARGTLNVYGDAGHFDEAKATLPMLADVGIDVEVVDTASLLAREPALKPTVAGAFFNRGDAQLRPDRYVAELARVARVNGVRIDESTRIEGLECENGRVARVVTDRGAFRARDIVFALGAWSPQLANQLGLCIPIQPGKGYSITYTRPDLCPTIPLTLKEPSVCVTAWPSGFRLGSTMEFAGYDSTLNRTRLDAIKRGAALFLHQSQGSSVVEEWFGWRPMTPDDLPVIGRAPKHANLIMATGHGMLGVSLSAVTGSLVADIVTRSPPAFDLAPFDPARFT